MQKNQLQRCVIYARFSCHNQSEQSIEGQVRDCTAYAEQHNLVIVDTYIDRALTATSDRRPEFQRMIKDSEKKLFDCILVWKLDRFARNRYDSSMYKHRLSKNGVNVVSVMENIADTPEGVLMESILEGFAEYYSRDLSQKVSRGMRETALKHKITGIIPFGYKKSEEGTYVPDETTAPVVRRIFEMYVDGELGKDIAAWINSLGYKTTAGKKFTQQSVIKIIQRSRYTGRYNYGDLEIIDENQRIVSDDIFNRAQKRRIANKHLAGQYKANDCYLLSTKLYCGICRRPMHGESGYGKNGAVYHYYKCSGRRLKVKCQKQTVRKDDIEQLVIDNIVHNVLRGDVVQLILDTIMRIQSQRKTESPEVALIKSQLAGTEKRMDNIMRAIEAGILTDTTQKRLKELEETKARLEYELELEKSKAPAISYEYAKAFLTSLSASDFNTPERKKLLIETFVQRVYLWDDRMIIIYKPAPSIAGQSPTDEVFDDIIKAISDNCSDIAYTGTPSGARTPDTLIKSQVLYQLS